MIAPLFDRLIERDRRYAKSDDWENENDGDYLVTPTAVWVAPAYVYSILPPGAATIEGGRAVKRSMAANGWQTKRTKTARWYIKERPSLE